MTKEQEIMDFLNVKMFEPILNSSMASERLKKATRGLRLRMSQRDAQGMIQYFWSQVADPKNKHANYGRILQNGLCIEFEEIANEFRLRFSEVLQ